MNSINIVGRLTKDPDLQHMDDDRAVCNFTLAVDDTYSKEDRTDFMRVSVFGKQAEICGTYLRKGLLAGVAGRFRSDSYTDSEGIKRYPVTVTADRVQILQWPERNQEKAEPEHEAERGRE